MKCQIILLGFLFLGINNVKAKSDVKSSLTFVIDDTGSMYDDIDEVKQGANAIFDTVMNSNSSQIEDFVLVTFNDPGVSLRTVTKDRTNFKQALRDIRVDGGGDCPEMAMAGIELALDKSRDASLLYVFTDASAKDYGQLAKVEALSQKKQSQVVFVLTGVCGSRRDTDYLVYHKLAQATSGQVFHLRKSEVGKILKYVSKTIESRKNVIASKSYPAGYGNSFDVEVDGHTKELVISVSGRNPSVEVTDSGGIKMPTEDITRLSEIAVVKVLNVKPDVYKVEVGSSSDTYVVVSGTTSVHFQHGFSVLKPTSITDTVARPVPGQKSHLSIKLSTEGGNVELKSVQILDMDDHVVLEKPLKLVDKKEQFYTTEPIDAPNHMFKVAIKGYDTESKTFLTRISLTPVKPQDPTIPGISHEKAPTVTIEGGDEINAEYDEALQLKCKVSGYPKPDIAWESDDPTAVTTQTDSIIELPSDFVSVLEIKKVNKNATYTCKAINKQGTALKSTVVKTKINRYFNVLELPKDITIEYATEGQVICKVDALPPASVFWYKNFKPLTTDENIKLSPDNETLFIRSMEPYIADNYICEARNDFERKVSAFKIGISGVELPKIDKTTYSVTTMKHSSVDIHCNIIKGKPKPIITWLYNDQFSSTFSKLNVTSDIVHLDNVGADNKAIFRCVVKNVIGEDYHDIDLIVEYPPVITKSVSPRVVKNEGETVTLKCPVDGGPTPDIVWRLNGSEIRSTTHKYYRDGSISFAAILSDKGNYECEAKNEHGVVRISTVVDVIVPVNIEPPKKGRIPVMVGSHAMLPCRADGYPKPIISWVFHSKDPKIPSKNLMPRDSSGSLSLQRIQQVEDGFYTCVANNAGGSKNITYEVIVLAPPFIKFTAKRFKAVVDDRMLRVPCHALGNPKPDILWMKNGFELSIGSQWFDVSEDGSLIIKDIDKEAAGSYVCQAKNAYGADHEAFDVIVDPYPQPGLVPNTIVLEEGKPAAITCNVPHQKTDRLRWFKNGILKAKEELRFLAVNPNDSGVYTCRVSSFIGAQTGTTKIVVGSKPRFYYDNPKDRTIEFADGGTAVMDCSIHGEQTPDIKWLRDGKKMDYNEFVYVLEMNSASDKGRYTCIVSNEFGSVQQEFEVLSYECALDIQKDFNGNAPLMVTPYLELAKFETVDGSIRIPRDEKVVLYCPAGFNKIPKRELMMSCANGKFFNYEGNSYSYTDLKCRKKVDPTPKRTGRRCNNGNSEMINVGFEIRGRFLEVYQVCLDLATMRTLYTKLNIDQSLANVLPNYGFSNGSFDDLNTLYDCNYQNNEISSILGKDFHTSDGCCFGRRQLVSPKDVAAGLPQIATFTSVNVVPHWSTCNPKNWDEVEQRIRKLAMSANHELQVWSGTAQELQLPDAYLSPKNITLPIRRSELPVPKYLWKVVQDPASKSSLAIIQVNVPDLMLKDARPYLVCRDVCGDVDWMRNRRWRNVDLGFTYCCQLSDFERAFRYSGIFPPHDKLLKNVEFVSEYYLHA